MGSKGTAREIAARMRAEEQRVERRRRNLRFGGALGASLAIVGGLTWLGLREESQATTTPIRGLQTFTDLARDHVADAVQYTTTPPVGGKHAAAWQNCGWYDAPIRTENGVHSLEHAAAWVTYAPQLSVSDKATLKAKLSGKSYVLASPFAGLPAPVVASAWGAQVKLTGVNDPRLAEFIKRYANSSSAPEPGGECTGGIGTPS